MRRLRLGTLMLLVVIAALVTDLVLQHYRARVAASLSWKPSPHRR